MSAQGAASICSPLEADDTPALTAQPVPTTITAAKGRKFASKVRSRRYAGRNTRKAYAAARKTRTAAYAKRMRTSGLSRRPH